MAEMKCTDETIPTLSDGRCGVCYDYGRLRHDANFWMQEAEQARAERDAALATIRRLTTPIADFEPPMPFG